MPENSESKEPREMSTEEVLLRDDIKDIFQANANIAGIGSLEAGIAATTLVGWLIPSEDFINPLITVTQAVIRANELTIIKIVEGLEGARNKIVYVLESEFAWLLDKEEGVIPMDTTGFGLVREFLQEARWDPRLSAGLAAAEFPHDMPDTLP